MNPIQLFDRDMPIFIYGTGTFAQDILDILRRHDYVIIGFLDHAPCQPLVHGLPVSLAEDVSAETRANASVIVGIHNRDANIASIIKRLDSLGYDRIITPIHLYDYFASDLGERFWLTRRALYTEHEEEIEAVAHLFADQTSRDLFHAIIHFRRSGDYSLLPEPDTQRQYFPADLFDWKNPLRLIDCGAYTGDTLNSFLNAGYHFEAVAAFEPDEENFRKLSSYVSQNQESFPQVTLFPCGVYSVTTQLIFEAGAGEASKISKRGANVIQCTSLDECIPTFSPSLIKMDIEGAEMEAILGARQLIKAFQPGLAISIYHAPAHLWQIPLCIQQLAKEYNIRFTYHLRAHAQNCFETIFYAIPEKQTI
jgi:FkbM family methyltransferase